MISVPCSLFSFGGVGLSRSFNIVAWPVSPQTLGTMNELSGRRAGKPLHESGLLASYLMMASGMKYTRKATMVMYGVQ